MESVWKQKQQKRQNLLNMESVWKQQEAKSLEKGKCPKDFAVFPVYRHFPYSILLFFLFLETFGIQRILLFVLFLETFGLILD